MTITNEQARDLGIGDIVKIRRGDWPADTYVVGPIVKHPSQHDEILRNTLVVLTPGDESSQYVHVVNARGEAPVFSVNLTLEVLERAPRSVYVNVHRDEYTAGDVVSHPGYGGTPSVYVYHGTPVWVGTPGAGRYTPWRGLFGGPDAGPIAHQHELTLLLDGITHKTPEAS